MDVITLIPWGEIGAYYSNKDFRILWYIKCIRLKQLLFIFNPKLFQPLINWFIETK